MGSAFEEGHEVFATTKGLQYICIIYNWLIQHLKQAKEFKEFSWVKLQINILRTLAV